jgi:sigma-B regulation protein RsbQ
VSGLGISRESIIRRNNITFHGSGDKVLMMAHGFGCDQRMWRFVLPQLSERYSIVLFDYVGSGNSELASFSLDRYASLDGYAQDVLDIIEALELEKVAFVGHSVSSMIGLIASINAPASIAELIMVCPSPCFLNDLPEYEGGFDKSDLEELIQLMDKNYIGWANYLAPLVMGANSSEALVGELSGSFCSTDPVVAKTFAKATFFSDHRRLLPQCSARTLVLQSASDSLASVKVGDFMHQQLPNNQLQIIPAEGHCLHMTDAEVTASAIAKFIG